MNNWFKIILFISMAINMFFIGFFLERFINNRNQPLPPYPRLPRMSSCNFIPPDSLKELKGNLNNVRKIQGEICGLVCNEPLNENLIKKKFAELRNESLKNQEQFHQVIISSLKKMPLEERKKIFSEGNPFMMHKPHNKGRY